MKTPSSSGLYYPAVGLLAQSQRYSTIEGEEVCQLWPKKKWLLEKVKDCVVVVQKRKLWDLEMILTGSQPTGQERCVSCRILHDPICYAQKTEVAHLTSWERSHILYGSYRIERPLNWIHPWIQPVWSNRSALIPTEIFCDVQGIFRSEVVTSGVITNSALVSAGC
jgi:hypothetical protein